jgi:Domain of unknown function (DUF4136)
MKTIALLAVFATACYSTRGSGPEVESAASVNAPLGEYRTFAFGLTESPSTFDEVSPRSLEVERRARDLMGAALRAKGYEEDDTKPNFVVRFGADIQQQLETVGVQEDSTGSSDGLSFGKIEVQIFDASTKTQVWRGSALSLIDLTKDIDNRLLERAVQGVLASFPARTATDAQPVANPVAAIGSWISRM